MSFGLSRLTCVVWCGVAWRGVAWRVVVVSCYGGMMRCDAVSLTHE